MRTSHGAPHAKCTSNPGNDESALWRTVVADWGELESRVRKQGLCGP